MFQEKENKDIVIGGEAVAPGEEKLLKIFYDVKLDSYFDLYPTSANIKDFGETKDPDDLDDWFGIN